MISLAKDYEGSDKSCCSKLLLFLASLADRGLMEELLLPPEDMPSSDTYERRNNVSDTYHRLHKTIPTILGLLRD